MLSAGAGVMGAAGAAACRLRRSSVRRSGLALALEVDAAVERAMAVDLSPALGVAVYSREGVYARGFGFADVGTRERASADTAFFIASSTKSVTALALACLHGRGELDLDASLIEISPQMPLPPATRPSEVRVRDLLAHVGGIVNRPINHRFTATGQHDPNTLWRLLAISEPNAAAPLGTFQYQNIGYNIATILTDRTLRVPWQSLLRREIFEPAGMTHTSASMSQAKESRWSIAKPHRLGPWGVRERHYLEKTDQTMHSAGGVVMSPQDAVRWLELMTEDGRVGGRRCVAAEVVQATRVPVATVGVEFEGYRRDQYGLGWYIGRYREEHMVHHFGGFSGFRAHISYLPHQAIGVAVFSNDSTVGLLLVNAIANFVYDRIAGYPDAGQRFDAALDGARVRYAEAAREVVADHARRANLQLALVRPLAAYLGVYESREWGRIEIVEVDRTLRVTCGVLRALAEPFDKPDAVWLELEPGEGGVLQFEGDGAAPDSLYFDDRRFYRNSQGPFRSHGRPLAP
ncbi:MAG: serine hydrolase domain-containing protein [Steroidobacteraceae bacterium]